MRLDRDEQLDHLRLAAHVSELDQTEIVLPEEHHVVLGDIRLHYVDWGTAGQRKILFLHGGGLTARTWDLVCLTLRTDYHCLALDQRGHGDSEWSPAMEYGLEDNVRDIERFADELDLEHFVLVGHSMGALTAIAYGGRHSDRLAALVLVDAGPNVSWSGDAARIMDFVLAPGELDSLDDFVERARAFNPRRDERLLRSSLLHNLRQLPNGKLTWKYDRRPLRQRLSELPAALEELQHVVPLIRCPTLLVRAALSDLFLDADAERFAARLQDGRWVRIEEAGHNVQGDKPRALVEALRRFFLDAGV